MRRWRVEARVLVLLWRRKVLLVWMVVGLVLLLGAGRSWLLLFALIDEI